MSFNFKFVTSVYLWALFVFVGPLIGQNETTSHQSLTELVKFTELNQHLSKVKTPLLTLQKPNVEALLEEDEKRDKNGYFYRFGVGTEVNITLENSGVWTTNDKGDRIWSMKIYQPDAISLSFFFSKFELKGDSYINVFNEEGRMVHETYTKKDVLESGVQNLSVCEGDLLTIVLVEPKGSPASVLEMDKVYYSYRSYGNLSYKQKNNQQTGSSGSCQVNVNCSEGSAWQDEKRGVVKIMISLGMSYGLCTGSLVNNTAQDCKPYILSAMHCFDNASQNNLNNTRFYFNFEAPSCENVQQANSSQFLTGAERLAGSDDVSGNTISHSDFYLLRIGTQNNEQDIIDKLKLYNAYWNGWDANNTAAPSGVSIHHPSGDIKKISTFTQPLVSMTYSGTGPSNTHWGVYWVQTANGHGVTEGGSSGSPIFTLNNGNSRIVGTLSGGSSSCSAKNNPDVYGKMSFHWESVGSTANQQLKPWLDPGNTGLKVLDGSSDPCNGGGGNPNPDPGTGACTPTIGQCDEYIASVTLNTINNNTGCNFYTDYSNISTTLTAGNTYQIGIVPGVVGDGEGYFYENDVVGVWVDWNGNGTFVDANETIVTHALTQSSPATHNLHVPAAIAPGTYVMRVRINYDASQSGNISPCDDSEWGEVEDYRIVISGGSSSGLNDLSMEAIQLYPNPTTGKVLIDLNSTFKNVEVVIYDITGKSVAKVNEVGAKSIVLDLSNLASGIYQVAVNTELGTAVKKVVRK